MNSGKVVKSYNRITLQNEHARIKMIKKTNPSEW